MRLWLSVCACVLVPVGGGPPARSPHASFARSGRSRSPARPCRRPPAPRPGPRCSPHRRCGALPARRPCRELCSEWSISKPGQALPPHGLFCWAGPLCVPVGGGPPARCPRRELRSARRFEARPGPATAHRHRGQAPQASLRPPIGRGVCVMSGQAPQASRRPRSVGLVVCVLTGSAVAHLRRGQVLQPLRRPPHRRGLVCWCVVRRSVISHAIRRPHCAGLYQFVMLRHLCL